MHAKPAATAVVADDERLMRDQIVGCLKEAWPELQIVGEAVNGREAVAMVQSLEPDIVFLDIRMPEMDGVKAARAAGGTGARRVRHGLRRICDQRLRAGRGRLPAEAGGARSELRSPVAGCASGCCKSPIRWAASSSASPNASATKG